MDIKLVIFDLAGTTVIDTGNINKAFRNAFSDAGYNVDAADVDKVMGYRKTDAIKNILDKYKGSSQEVTPHLITIIHNDFTKNMVQFYEEDNGHLAMPFAEEVFSQLQNMGIKIALNTGFPTVITDTILHRIGWDKSFHINAVASSDEVSEGRPHPFMIHKIMQQLNINHSQEVAKVGDTPIDIEEGFNAGCGLVVAITTGPYSREQLSIYNPNHIIDSLQQLPALIH